MLQLGFGIFYLILLGFTVLVFFFYFKADIYIFSMEAEFALLQCCFLQQD